MRKTLSLIAAAALALPSFAMADDGGAVAVSYADINLATPQGQQRLERRIEKAAREACGVASRSGSRIVPSKVRACLATARASARTEMAVLVEREARGG